VALSGLRDNLLIIEDHSQRGPGVSPLGLRGRSVDDACRRSGSATPRKARSEADLQYAIDAQKASWPVHPDRTKNWDCYIAVRHVLQHASHNERILDAGADRVSSFLPTLARMGHTDLTGINLLEVSCEPVGPITYEHGNIEDTGYLDNHFAFIACLSAIEHGVNVERFLKEAARILKPGGHLFISTDYWKDPIDTRVQGWRIFTQDGIMQMINAAAVAGFMGITIPNFGCNERVCHHKGDGWGGDYTFINLLLRKAA
jgi:SAM-dependent methyltransferase